MPDTGWIEEIRERLEAATDGPWEARDRGSPRPVWTHNGRHVNRVVATLNPDLEVKANADLIAHAPTDLRRLLEVVGAAERLVAKTRHTHLMTSMQDGLANDPGATNALDRLRAALNRETTDE